MFADTYSASYLKNAVIRFLTVNHKNVIKTTEWKSLKRVGFLKNIFYSNVVHLLSLLFAGPPWLGERTAWSSPCITIYGFWWREFEKSRSISQKTTPYHAGEVNSTLFHIKYRSQPKIRLSHGLYVLVLIPRGSYDIELPKGNISTNFSFSHYFLQNVLQSQYHSQMYMLLYLCLFKNEYLGL